LGGGAHGQRTLIHPVDCSKRDLTQRVDVLLGFCDLVGYRAEEGFDLSCQAAHKLVGLVRKVVVAASLFHCRRLSDLLQPLERNSHLPEDLHHGLVHGVLRLVLLFSHEATEVLNELAHLVGHQLLVVRSFLHGSLERAAHLGCRLFVGALNVGKEGLEGCLDCAHRVHRPLHLFVHATHLSAEGVLQLGHEACKQRLEHVVDLVAVASGRDFHGFADALHGLGDGIRDGLADSVAKGVGRSLLGGNLPVDQVRHHLVEVFNKGVLKLCRARCVLLGRLHEPSEVRLSGAGSVEAVHCVREALDQTIEIGEGEPTDKNDHHRACDGRAGSDEGVLDAKEQGPEAVDGVLDGGWPERTETVQQSSERSDDSKAGENARQVTRELVEEPAVDQYFAIEDGLGRYGRVHLGQRIAAGACLVNTVKRLLVLIP
jgi:hypothetical protein